MDEDHDAPLPLGDPSKEDADYDALAAAKDAAMAAAEAGRLDEAIAKYTEAIEIMVSPIVYARRAAILLKAKRPNAAINDCDAALAINPDSAKALKVRGCAHRALGHYERAAQDLHQGVMIDFDEESDAVRKWVDAFLKQRRAREQAIQLREAKKRQRQRAKEQASAGGMPGMGGIPPELLGALMSDPELMTAFQDPEIMTALQDVMSNPANMAKYSSNPKVQNLIAKMTSKFGGGEAAPDATDQTPPAAPEDPGLD